MKTAFIINSDVLGTGPEELGKKLMGSFLRKVCAQEDKPDTIIFYNTGVKLLAKGVSDVLDALGILQDAGVDLLGCGTCADYFSIKDKITAGRIGSMDDIVAVISKADKVVTVT